jgi:hypothetical protein
MPPDEGRINPRTALSDDDKALLREWRTALILQDHRYEPKMLMSLAALAMADPDFRSRLVNDTAAALDEFRDQLEFPDGYEFRFHENTQTTMHVVLPPPGGEAGKRPAALRRLLSSRTDETVVGVFSDDFNYADLIDGGRFGVPTTADHTDGNPRDFF